MSLISGTATSYDLGTGNRESLDDVIYDISPEDVPFSSSIRSGKRAKSTYEEWQTDSLASADGSNAQLEGDDATFSTPSDTTRVGNYCQISNKTLVIADTQEVVDKAGKKSELAYQVMKKGAELKRDIETIFLQAQAADAGGSGTARTLAALNAWLKTNTDAGTCGGDPTYTSGAPGAVRTDSTTTNQRAFTETIAKSVIQSMWSNGGNPRVLMVGPVNKQRVSTDFGGIATRNFNLANVNPKPTAVIATA
ncbi:MAG TPA: DUF5309 family protein, partial [Candidatus Krumholzibacteria bacterium]|nr:DUF5309 family protein [Candidatus Krumholzibacteria bacterium]